MEWLPLGPEGFGSWWWFLPGGFAGVGFLAWLFDMVGLREGIRGRRRCSDGIDRFGASVFRGSLFVGRS